MKNSTLNILRARQQKTILKSKKQNVVVSPAGSPIPPKPKPEVKENPLIGASTEQQDAHNAILNRIGQLAFAVPAAPSEEQEEDEKELFSSPFFFVLPDDYAEANKNSTGIESLPEEPFNVEILAKTEVYKNEVGEPVKSNIELVSDFILNEITPLLLGLDGGVTQARSVIQNTISDVDQYPFTALELLTREAVKLKLGAFIKTYFDLSDTDVENLVAKILPPKQREVVVPVPMEGSKYETRPREVKRTGEDRS